MLLGQSDCATIQHQLHHCKQLPFSCMAQRTSPKSKGHWLPQGSTGSMRSQKLLTDGSDYKIIWVEGEAAQATCISATTDNCLGLVKGRCDPTTMVFVLKCDAAWAVIHLNTVAPLERGHRSQIGRSTYLGSATMARYGNGSPPWMPRPFVRSAEPQGSNMY